MNELISVIIPTYNAGSYLKEAVDSALNQTIKNIEIIIINDGSTDDTEEIIKPYIDNSRVIYIAQKNSGLAGIARNEGIKKARGEYIAFLDADDVWEEKKLEKQITLFNDNIALVYSDGKIFGNTKKDGKKFSDFSKFYRGDVFHDLIKNNFITTSSVIIKKEALNNIGYFSEELNLRVGEDYDLWLRISQKYKIDYSDEVLFKYRIVENGLTANKTKAYKNILYLYKTWLNKKISFKEKILFLYSYCKTYLKIIYKNILK